MQKSEFGKGLTYCLGLFLCHSERDLFGSAKGGGKKYEEEMDKRMVGNNSKKDYSYSTELWFNGASDHLYDLQIPEELPIPLKKRLAQFQNKIINWGHGFHCDVTKEDKAWAIQEAKELLILIDKFHGVKIQKGRWQ